MDYDYKFSIAEVGCQGRISDEGVLRNSAFKIALSNNGLNLRDTKYLTTTTDLFWVTAGKLKKVPVIFVADDTLPLTKHCMKPYGRKSLSDQERAFDYRCSRFRTISENALGIWCSRFILFATRASLTPERAEIAVMANLTLHNLLRTKSRQSYRPIGSIDFENDTGEKSLQGLSARKLFLLMLQVYSLQHLVEQVSLLKKFEMN